MKFPLGLSYTLRTVNADAQRCVNLYPERNELGTGKEQAQYVLIGTPGYRTFSYQYADGGAVRGLYTASNGRCFGVIGNRFVEFFNTPGMTSGRYDETLGFILGNIFAVSGTGTSNILAKIATNAGLVSMADNGSQLALVDGSGGYVFTFATGVLAQITDVDFPKADVVVFQDGYFIFNHSGTQQFFVSSINDGTAYDALDFASAEGSPDLLVSLLSDHRELWLFGSQSTEVWFNSGNPDFPFERIQGAIIEHGTVAPHSCAKLDNAVVWLSQDSNGGGMVMRSQGYQGMRISTHALEFALQGYSDLSDAVAYTYQEEGHSFYVLNFLSAATTWVYDAATGLWHERQSHNFAGTVPNPVGPPTPVLRPLANASRIIGRARANCHTYAFGKHLLGDYENGYVYESDLDYGYDAEQYPLIRTMAVPHISFDQQWFYYRSWQLDLETGVGLDGAASTQGADPTLMLQWSNDGGHTWSNELLVSLGKIGEYRKRAIARRLGRARDRVFRISISDPVKVAILGMYATVELAE